MNQMAQPCFLSCFAVGERKQKGQKICRRNRRFLELRGRGRGNRRDRRFEEETEDFWGFAVGGEETEGTEGLQKKQKFFGASR